METIIHLLCHFIFSWIFDTIIISSYPKFVLSYILLVLLIEKYIIYTLFAVKFEYLSNKYFHHFKILSITLFAYFCSVIIFNTSSLFYFPVVGRTFIFVMFISIASSIFFDRYQVKHEKIERDLAIQTQNILKEKEYIYKRISVDEKERKMRHDVRNNLDIVYGYLRDKKYEKAENLVKELLGVVEERDALIHTGNVSIDSVIDDKLSLAKEKNIIYEENTKNMYYGDIEINELALLIGLALDNAIEACEKVEENRYIYFEARNKKDYLVIHITNSIIPHTKPRFYKTSKLVDKMNHGFGVEEIKDIVKRYDGDIQYDTKKDKVILRIILKTRN
ncbi:sensor histidine kinase [Longibaculum muris]|uniref:sensor histidine kinase n=1 Tax=Longibaculum muris TaxID=1796628 RepID=UPI0022E9807E|nr:GHKL domain-containing protein [Longibaculum muris]